MLSPFVYAYAIFVSIEATQTCQGGICLTWYRKQHELILICDIESFTSVVTLYHENDDVAYCAVPFPRPHCFSSLKNSRITQDIVNDITVLKIQYTTIDLYQGKWTCVHKDLNQSVIINNFSGLEECTYRSNIVLFILTICLSVGIIGLLIFKLYNKHIWKVCIRSRKKLADDESQPLIGKEKTEKECCLCQALSVCAVCATCESFYCELCCDAHTRGHPMHNVCLIDHVKKTKFEAKCTTCKKKEPTSVCLKCKQIMCTYCTCTCESSENIDLVPIKQKTRMQPASGCSSISQFKYKLELPNTDSNLNRVCGLCFLNDETAVVADINNKKIKVINKDNNGNEKKFNEEPRGMTHMYENQVAVTFAYNQEILIFDLSESKIEKVGEVSLDKIGKPYSIAYNADHFAVEIGESEAGFIAILDSNGEMVHKIYNKRDGFAYFTGNTIRLALDMNNGRLFVAGLSKNVVSCITFTGHTLWKVPISSPRGIVFLPGIQLEDKNLILASKRHDTVYQMSSKNGNTEVLISEKIEGPRYMAYNHKTKLLCIQMGNNKLEVYKYEIK